MKKETFLLMEKLVNILIKEKFEFIEIDESEYSDLTFTIKISNKKEVKK